MFNLEFFHVHCLPSSNPRSQQAQGSLFIPEFIPVGIACARQGSKRSLTCIMLGSCSSWATPLTQQLMKWATSVCLAAPTDDATLELD